MMFSSEAMLSLVSLLILAPLCTAGPPAMSSWYIFSGASLAGNKPYAYARWSVPSGVFDHYEVTIHPSKDVNIQPPRLPKSRTYVTFFGLSFSTQYTVTLRTVDASGKKGTPNQKSFKSSLPMVDSTTIVISPTKSGAIISWRPAEGNFDHYEILPYSSYVTVDRSIVPANTRNPQVSATVTIPGEYQRIRIRCRSGSKLGSYAYSPYICRAPAAVQESSISVSEITAISAKVKWDHVSEGKYSYYHIGVKKPGEEKTKFVVKLHLSNNPHQLLPEYVLNNLEPEAKYILFIETSYYSNPIRSDTAYKNFATAKPDIVITDITTTSAIASWTASPGSFDYYNVSLRLYDSANDKWLDSIRTWKVPSSMRPPSVKLVDLTPGASYRVEARTVTGMGLYKGPWKASPNFDTKPVSVDESTFVIESITTTSASFKWGTIASKWSGFQNYSIRISPTTGGVTVNPATVARPPDDWFTHLSTHLMNLTQGTEYTVVVTTQYGGQESAPAKMRFRTEIEQATPTSAPINNGTAVAALVLAVICLILIVVNIVLLVLMLRRNSNALAETDRTDESAGVATVNRAFQGDSDHSGVRPNESIYENAEIIAARSRDEEGASKAGVINRFKDWLLSQHVSEATYAILEKEGYNEPALFAALNPDDVPQLSIKQHAQRALIQRIASGFSDGENPFNEAMADNSDFNAYAKLQFS